MHAVDDVSFELQHGELLGLVGESGSGKSTVANCVMRLTEPTAGEIRLRGVDITHLSRRAMRPLRRELHMVFQDPYSSLNPRMSCGDIVGEPLRLHRIAKGRELRRARRPDLRHRRPAHRAALPLPARAVGRAAPARRPRTRADPRAERPGRGRARLGARRIGAGVDPQPAARPPAQHGLLLPVHHARPRDGRVPLRPRRCDVPRQARRARTARGALPQPAASLHAGAALGRCRPRPGRAAHGDSARCSRATFRARSIRPPGCRFRTRCPLEPRSAPRSTEEEPRLIEFARDHLVACHLVAPNRPAPRLVAETVEIAK